MDKKVIVLDKNKFIDIIYWLIPLFLFIFQLAFTLKSTGQIRYEELAESVRNVFWLHNGLIYDGISSNVGWYGTLLFIYHLFGFTLNTAKIFRLLLHFVSLYCLSAVLMKYLGSKKAFLPLIAFGLSPTLLYLNTLQTSYGIDLQYLPITLFLLTFSNHHKRLIGIIFNSLFWLLNMWAWMSYPTYIFYLPSLVILYLYFLFKEYKSDKKRIITQTLVSSLIFIIPLLICFLFLKNRQILFYDPVEKSGLFRGAGTFTLNLEIFISNITHLTADLFSKGNSYYFEFVNGEFSGFYPLITLFTITISLFFIYKLKIKYRPIILLSLLILLFSILVSNFSLDPTTHPGIRRNTALIASIYILFTISWYFIASFKFRNKYTKTILTVCFLLLPLHHFFVYFQNLGTLNLSSRYKNNTFFILSKNPTDSLDSLLNILKQKDLPLSCQNNEGKPIYCRYSEIYSALYGSCIWNKLSCRNILGYDFKTEKNIPISIALWENYYWPH
jgi:hypothetical protein